MKLAVYANLSAFSVFAIWHLLRTPFLLDADRARALAHQKNRAEDLQHQVDELKQKPVAIQVRLRELYRRPPSKYEQSPFDLFLRVRLELQHPVRAEVTNYKFELSMNGQSELPELKRDLEEWVLTTWNAQAHGAEMIIQPLNPLPSTLAIGEPVEGWLHFATVPTKGEMLEKCAVRLIVQTANGSNYGEHGADPDIWNPRKVSISRKIGARPC